MLQMTGFYEFFIMTLEGTIMASKFKAITIGDLDGFAVRATCFLRGQVLLTTPKYKTGPMLQKL